MEDLSGESAKFPKFESMSTTNVHARTDLSAVTKLIYYDYTKGRTAQARGKLQNHASELRSGKESN